MASSQFPVAIIGMATRLPGAQTCDQFWELLKNGGDSVAKFPVNRVQDIEHAIAPFRGKLVNEDEPFFTGSFFHSVDTFDAKLFQINPREALFIEPEQRFFLETTWEAIEDAGYASTIRGSNTGVYVGNTVNKYKFILTENHPSISHGNHSPFISSRVSYTHNLQGPAMMVATGCSSSLLAVHVACQGLLSGDCDMAIAGGITLDLLPVSAKTDIWNQLGITGPNVKCRAFDASAKGIAKGEGCGVVILKPLAKAKIDGDHIYGVLAATTANQDGHSNGITAPHPGAQANMLHRAWELADISPDKLGYFETHGTGTELGDPIEISGITKAFKTFGYSYRENDRENKIPIGSVKANIGHLADGAAGVVSLIKVLMCLQKEKIPPAINFTKPNPHINWDTSPVYVNTVLKEWPPSQKTPTRYASVSAFGLLGTNVHAVVREYDAVSFSKCMHVLQEHCQESQLLTLAANTRHSLVSLVGKFAKYFHESETKSYLMLRNVCYTLNTGREQKRFKHRAIAFGTTWELMAKALEDLHLDLNSTTSAKETDTLRDYGHFVNFGNTSYRDIKLPSNIDKYAKLFLDLEDTCWNKFYAEKNGLKKVSLLPNYAFELTRFWPEVGKTINSGLLQLEHRLTTQGHFVHDSLADMPALSLNEVSKLNKPGDKLDCSATPSVDVKIAIQNALNEVLSTDYDWNEMLDENLFALGMDSLLYTQLSMKLQDIDNCKVTLAAFHDNPTCAGLIDLVEKHVNAQAKPNELTEESREEKRTLSEEDVKSILGRALNHSLAADYDWQERENENLFTLGFDSLTWTQMNMKLANILNISEPLTMHELRKFPTYSSLWKIIYEKLCPTSAIREIQSDDQPKEKATNEKFSNKKQCSSNVPQAMFPLSFSQKRLWVMEQIAVSSCAYNATNCLRITGNFHSEAFSAAANTVLSRHAAFFTTITDTKEGPTQTHDWKLDAKVEEIDMKQFGFQAEERVTTLYRDDYKTRFDLRAGRPVRCKLYCLPNDVFYFTMVVHHIVFDGWSHFVFYNELWDSYKKLCEGKKIKEEVQRPLYAEFAKEEQDGSLHEQMETHVTYWKEKLDSPLPLTTFPGDKRRPAVFTHQGKRITRILDKSILEALRNFSSDKYTVFVKLLSVVYALLHQYTGDRDLIIGTPVAGRNDLRFKHVIGCFVNTLALRVQLSDACTFSDILEEVSAIFLEAFDHQIAPFDHVVSQLNLPRDTSITPVFSVNVCYHNTEIKAEHTSPPSEITVERKLQHNETTKWDMQFDFLQEPEGTRFTLEYYSDLFSDLYAETVVDNFIWLLESCCENSNTPLMQLGNLKGTGQKETQGVSILRGPFRKNEKSLPVLIMESLQTHAESTAIIEANELQITYKKLLERALKCSFFLREVCKLPKQSRVGLLLENSVETIEYILASLLSGLVYVPMDPSSPKPRLEHVCKEAEIKAIIFGKLHIGIANDLHWACSFVQSIICVDSQDLLAIQDVVENSPLMDADLWNCVAKTAKNDIESGGWKSSYNGEHMSVEEMEEYAENILTKLKDHLKPTTRVLEIGCASGLTVQKLSPRVGEYVATDLSEIMTKRLEAELRKKVVTNVEVLCIPADRVERKLRGRKFDVIVMNSVVHCFPGHNYLRAVLKDCERLLDKGGVLFLGDVMDLDLKEKLVMSLKSFKKAHPECRVKTDWRNELFLSRAFMQHLCDSSNVLKSVMTSRKHYTVANELTEFRFDALFTTTSECQPSGKQALEKQVFALRDVTQALENKHSDTVQQVVSEWSRDIQLEDEAYVLYTSGTTGTPKGVIIGHEALVNYVTWATKAYQFDSSTLTPFFAPLTFDFTVTSIFPPLLGGSIIRVFNPFQDSYQSLATSTEITTAKYSPLQLDTILSNSTQPLSASTFILGGEELTSALLQKLKTNKRDCPFVVWNEYGPTEATVGCVVRCLTSDELPTKEYQHIPIGKPIDNVTVAVLRNQRDPVPQGAKGHLAIGGKCLCLDFAGSGVSRDAKRTKSFRASCWGRPGELMLLTEDIVELMPLSGELVCFGRDRDSHTTKINGIRVDLMEVQRIIEADPAVISAWACTFTHKKHTLLGAAVKLEDFKQGKCGDLTWKQHLVSSLADVLPIRSIPQVFVQLSAAPTNKNGKKDVDFLQKLFLAEMIAEKVSPGKVSTSSNSYQGLLQTAKLQRIWQSILPVDYLPKPEDDFFFDLSGDSLQAIHLVRKMREEGFQVSVTDVFQNPSIQKLTPILKKREGERIRVEVSSKGEQNPFRPTPIIEEFFERHPPLKQPDRFSLSAVLNFHDEISTKILEMALKSVIKKHGSLRSRFGVKEGRVFQQLVPIELNKLTVKVLEIEKSEDHLADEPMFIELCDRLEQSHSLANGHLVNAAVVNVSEKGVPETREHFVLLVVHHVALDIVSWQQLLEDLASALRKLSEDDTKEPELKKCEVTFQTYCKALQAEAERAFIDEIDYWRGIEEEYRKSGRLIEEDKQSNFRTAKWVSEAIDASLIRSTSSELECSEENILLTSFGRALVAIHGQDKTGICLESHGRQLTTVDSTDTVGWLTSFFPVILHTPLSGDLVSQAKDLGQKMSMIPNHGLGFGVLKSKQALRMPLPKIMFVYQGSMDASTKETFDGGRFSFNHIPWIEVMLNELKEGRFHRHPEEFLEYDLEIIAWVHGGKLKFGCLFDGSVVNEEVIRDLIKQAQLNVIAMAGKAKTKPKEISVEIIPGFNIAPECLKAMTDALAHHATIPNQVRVQPPEQMLQVLCTPHPTITQSSADVALIIPRPKNTAQGKDLMNACSQSNSRVATSKSVVLVNTENLPNTSKLPTPLLADQVSLEISPENLSSFYDDRSDTEYNMPLTRAGYWHLGVTMARAVRACAWGSTYKVIAVDADYTLWDGECAEGSVRFNEGNYELHEFLLKKKAEGMLLVILSKNSQADVESVFELQKNDMKLKKNDFTVIVANWEPKSKTIRHVSNLLNLGIDSFVFVDDNPVECEKMVRCCPEVLTLQLPSLVELVAPLVQNLWALDRVQVSSDASKRTEMYRSELARQVELQGVQLDAKKDKIILNELLLSWEMKLEICKTCVPSLRSVKKLYTRTKELLQRTNQFKMNDLNNDLIESSNNDIVWLVSLKDKHGAYGIVSVLLLKSTSDFILVTQWVVSCRALGRGVEGRILKEIHKEAMALGKGNHVNFAINKTERNTPALEFLDTVGIETSAVSASQLNIVCSDSLNLEPFAEPLHDLKEVSDLSLFFNDGCRERDVTHQEPDMESILNSNHARASSSTSIRTTNVDKSFGKPPSLNETSNESSSGIALEKLNEWIETNWSQSLKHQALYHHVFPLITNPRTTVVSASKGQEAHTAEKEMALRSSWMEVLQNDKAPEDSDTFVQSGGNSFSAVYLVSMLRRLCAIEISIVDVLQNHTYGEIKNIVKEACPVNKEPSYISRPEHERHVPLTSAQKRMVLMQETSLGSAAYVETLAYRTNLSTDPKEIISALVQKHPILKSKITMNKETLEYSRSTETEIKIDITSEVVHSPKVSEAFLKKTTPVIQITDSSLFKARFITAKEENILALHVHHVIVDDVTLTNISSDFEQLIHSGIGDNESSSICSEDYANYVKQEESYLISEKCKDDEEFWKQKFESLLPDSNLALRPIADSNSFATRVFPAKHFIRALSVQSADEIADYCCMRGLTEFQYFLSCAALVLQRYLGVGEITLAIPVTTRMENHEKTDGLFVNTVLFTISVDHSFTLKEHMQTVATQWLKALRHSNYPLDQVTKMLWKTQGKNSNSFCSVMFNYAIRSQKTDELSVFAKDAKMPLSLDVVKDQESNQSTIVAEWADQLIDDGIVERLLESIIQLCVTAYKEEENSINQVQVLSIQEHNLLQSFTTTPTNSTTDKSYPVHLTFEEFARKTPHATAVAIHERRLSYCTLDELSSTIANALLDELGKDVIKNSPVVIVANKDEYLIAAILGVWKSGGHFLPVATTNQSSLKNVLGRNKPAAILTNLPPESIILNEEERQRSPLLVIEDLTKHSKHKYNESQVKVTTKDLAYIIQTSGSTGTPKQCKISHRSLRIISNAWKDQYAMTEFKVNVLQWAPISFDVFVGDVVRALICAPGQLTICPDKRRLDIPYILQLIENHHITMIEVTPLFGQQLVTNANQDSFSSIKVFIFGSDVLQRHVYHTIKGKLRKDQRVLNSYGMTEATIDSAFFEGDILPTTRSDTVPIGKPLPGVGLHVLDSTTLLPCPVGTIGELYISGEVLASGDVDLLPISHLPCHALKTGDAACWLPSGDIELMGRMDNMVKLRGFRISTTEIENKIVETIDHVTQACVVILQNEHDTGTEFLCAFLVTDQLDSVEITIDRNLVCSKLKGGLPYYMWPDIVHTLPEIPLSSNGKVNHKALPKVSKLLESTIEASALQASSVESSTTSTLKGLFAEALGLSDAGQIDPTLTFMEQGAHSLILVKFSTLISQKTSFSVTIADIFSYPTISMLEEFITQEAQSDNEVSTQPLGVTMVLPFTNDNVKDIAVTGIALRLPGNIMTLPQLWEVLESGRNIMGDFSERRRKDILNCVSLEDEQTLLEAETFQGAFLDRIDEFDNKFFKIPPGEAKFMSPEQRMFLQVATEALAESEPLSKIHGSKTGVFVGSSEIGYSRLQHPDEATCISGLLPGMIASRVAYQWDFKGPTMLVDTACSSSLIALKEACESIKRGECDGALVGGVSLVMYPSRSGVYGKNSILSEDFRCKAFDKDATGTAVGEGVLCLYVEPLETASAKGKPIYGVVKSVESNSVGRGNGITAPSASSQRNVILSALNSARVQPSEVTYIEGHGTGTKLGDRIELSALRSVFDNSRQTETNLAIGSVKSVFGHLDSAAGMLGVFKTLASLNAKKIPPTAHFKTPHPEIANSRLEVSTETVEWHPSSSTYSRIAGVSSFGLTGTNCHAIIAEAPNTDRDNLEETIGQRGYHLLVAGSSLDQLTQQLLLHKIHTKRSILKSGISTIAGLCLTVARRLKEITKLNTNMKLRLVISAHNPTQMLEVLEICENVADLSAMKQLARLRRDIEFCCPQHDEIKTSAFPDVASFLQHGTINVDGLFYGESQTIQPSPEVTLVIYNQSRHWLDPLEKIEGSTFRMNVVELLGTKLRETRELIRNLPLRPADDLQEKLDSFCSAIIIKLFLSTSLNDYLMNGNEITFNHAFSLSKMMPKYEKLFFVMIRELWRNNLLEAIGTDETIHSLDSFVFKCSHHLDVEASVIAEHAIKMYPSWADCFRFPLYCSQHLEKVVRGNMSPLSVIYPRGDLNFMFQFDKLGDLTGDVYYNMYMQLIASYAKQLSRLGKHVRILEVGAGVGHVTRQILPKLKDIPKIEYWFTDLGKAFVDHARTTFSDYLHMMKFSTFDITKSAPKQGLFGSFDIIVSYNVIHTTQSIVESLLNLKSCLGDDGKLFIIESAKNETWATLAWGILDGWWYFKDYDLRPFEPMLEPEKWEQVLKSAGFQSVVTCPSQSDEREHVEKFLFLCSEKPASDSKKSLDLVSCLGWWKTDIDRFGPVKKLDELQNEFRSDDDSNKNAAHELKVLVGEQNVYEELKKIWSDLLGEDNIHPEHDFNSLGGESLLAIQMMNLVKKRIGFQLEIADTFGYPTLGALARFITNELHIDTKEEAGFHSGSPLVSEVSLKGEGTLLMFPGQGSQKVGMCVTLKDSKEAREVFQLAEEVLGYSILDIILGDEVTLKQKLKSTEFVQVALFVGCLAKIEQLKAEKPEILANVTHVAGLSVGEFAALVYAGVINFHDALHIVSERGKAMENIVRETPTGMVSVFGPKCEQLETFLQENYPAMMITTYLADNQHTVGGKDQECDAFVESLSREYQEKMDVIDVRKLRVAGAFHSPYMDQASEGVNKMIMRTAFTEPTVPIVMNVNGDIVADPLEMKKLLCRQLTAAVKWKQSVLTAYELGVRSFIEVAPARVLSSIVKNRIKHCQHCHVEYIQL